MDGRTRSLYRTIQINNKLSDGSKPTTCLSIPLDHMATNENIKTIKKNSNSVSHASKEVGTDVNA
jgi:hypothetical protein